METALSDYVRPENVTAPKSLWQLDRVVINRGPGKAAWAIGRWEGDPVIATRWNGHKERPLGTPYSRATAVWFIIENEAYGKLIEYLVNDKDTPPALGAYVREFLSPALKAK
jgi:hypothetical protein